MSDEASDVTKALAAFGAPAIRYHSFGQSAIRPSSVVLPRRPPAPQAESAAPLTQQAEPEATAEPLQPLRAVPHPVPSPAPIPQERDAAHPTMFAPGPTVAPPPRPLAEWAAPVSLPSQLPAITPMPPQRPVSAPVPLVSPPVIARDSGAPVAPPIVNAPPNEVLQAPVVKPSEAERYSTPRPMVDGVAPPLPRPVAVSTRPAPPLLATVPPVHGPIPASPEGAGAGAMQARTTGNRTLAEIFALLAAAPAR